MNRALKLLVIFCIGILGGIFADQILWPYFIERPLFYQYRLNQAPVYINKEEKIFVQENTALQDSFEAVEKTVAGIKSLSVSGKNGSGVLVTSDGLILTLNEIIPKSESQTVDLFLSGEKQSFRVIKRDSDKNLALLKIEKNNLSTIGFADFGSLRFGQRIFLASASFNGDAVGKMANEGLIKSYTDKNLHTNIIDPDLLAGSPIFNIKGELVGLAVKDKTGKISGISISVIRDFIGF